MMQKNLVRSENHLCLLFDWNISYQCLRRPLWLACTGHTYPEALGLLAWSSLSSHLQHTAQIQPKEENRSVTI